MNVGCVLTGQPCLPRALSADLQGGIGRLLGILPDGVTVPPGALQRQVDSTTRVPSTPHVEPESG